MKIRPVRRSLRTQLLVVMLAFASFPPLVLTWWHYAAMREATETSTRESLQALARAKAAAIDQFTQDRRTEVERIASLTAPDLGRLEPPARPTGGLDLGLPALEDAEALQAPAEEPAPTEPAISIEVPPQPQPPSAGLNDLRRTLGLILWDQRRFEELLVLDRGGRVVASTFPDHEGRTAENLAYFRNGLGATHLEPVFVSPITGQLTTVVATPVRDPQRGVLGVLAARLNLERFFRLAGDVTGLGVTGEVLLGKVEGDEVVLMAPTRHDPQAALARRLPVASVGLAEAARGRSGVGRYRDYRGVDVLAAWEPIPSLGWGLVAKIDRDEALRPVRAAAVRMAALLGVVVLIGAVAAVLLSREAIRPLHRLRQATERVSRGDFDVDLGIRRNDEIGQLAASFERMVVAIRYFRAHTRPDADEEDADDEGVAT